MSNYIAMNRFRIVKGQESEFEEIWKTRNTYLESEPGFIKFDLLKGPEKEDHILYASHILYGNLKSILTHGQNPKLFAKHMPVPAIVDTCI